jgi:hypothetical protein
MDKNNWKDIKKTPIPFDLDGYDEVTKSVLLTDGNEIWVGAYWKNGKQGLRMSTIPQDEYGIMGDATHWQELPEMPGEREEITAKDPVEFYPKKYDGLQVSHGEREEITATCQDRVDIGAKP